MSEQGTLSMAPFWLRSNSRMLVFNLLLKLTMRVPVFPSASVCVPVCVCAKVKPQNNNLAAICYNAGATAND